MPGARAPHTIWDEARTPDYEALRLRTVIDLRSDGEVGATPSAWAHATGADVVRLPIAEGVEGTDTDYVHRLIAGTLHRFDAADLTRFYIVTLERRAAVFAEAVRLLGDAGRLPLLVHCSAGKDRTGLLVALVLSVLGTPRERIVADYALTGELRPNRIADYAPMLPVGSRPRRRARAVRDPGGGDARGTRASRRPTRRRGGPPARPRRPRAGRPRSAAPHAAGVISGRTRPARASR